MKPLRAMLLLVAVLAAAVHAGTAGRAQTQDGARQGIAVLAEIEGVIGPAAARHVETAVADADARDADILILQLNTPGGLSTSMREIIAHMLASRTPVVGYVAPPGGHAASAGTYILYATHVAAMAPGTNIGAATPVQIGATPGMPETPAGDGQSDPIDARDEDADDARGDTWPSDPMTAKAVNDAVAYIRSLAELRERNAEWAEAAVREAASLSAQAALDEGVIEIVAADVDDLLEQLDGRTVELSGEERALATAALTVVRFEPAFMTQVLGVLANPNVAFLLMLIGTYGLIYEFATPGSIGPGVIGAIALVLGLYALNQLPLNYAGLALIVLGVIFMAAEAFTPTFGVLGFGGLVAFIVGSAMLFDTDVPEFQLSRPLIAGAAAVSGAVLILVLGYVVRAHRRPPVTGREGLVGATAEVIDWAGGRGHVWIAGERWNAEGGEFEPGQNVYITAEQSLRLTVAALRASRPRGDAS